MGIGAEPLREALRHESGSRWKTGEDEGRRDKRRAALEQNRESDSNMGGWWAIT